MISQDALEKQESFFDYCYQIFNDARGINIYRVWLKTSVPTARGLPNMGKGFPIPCLYLAEYISQGARRDSAALIKRNIEKEYIETIIDIFSLIQFTGNNLLVYFPTIYRNEWNKIKNSNYQYLLDRLRQKGVFVTDNYKDLLFVNDNTCIAILQLKRTRNNAVKLIPEVYRFYKSYKPSILSIAIFNEIDHTLETPSQPISKRDITKLVDEI
jgi:hypothetical protein